MKKAGKLPSGKSGSSGHFGSNGGKLGASGPVGSSVGKIVPNSGKIGSSNTKLGSTPKITTFPSSSHKSYESASFNTSKSGKSSSSFGILWLPTRKRNKYKEVSNNAPQHERIKDRGPSMYGFMSGDSSNNQTFLDKKKEETHFLVPESKASTSLAIAEVGTVTSSEFLTEKPGITEEKQDLIKHDEEESKEAVGDGDRTNGDYLENNDKVIENAPTSENKEKVGDNVDSVFLRSPPPHKTRSSPPAVEEEEDCGIKCLYYTLQCCDCVLM